MQKKSVRDLIGEIERLHGVNANGVEEEEDSVLAGIMGEIERKNVGAGQEIFDIWKKSFDKDAVEQMFRVLTGVRFEDYLQKCRDALVEKERKGRDDSFSGNFDLISGVVKSCGWHFVRDLWYDGDVGFWHTEIKADPPLREGTSIDIRFDNNSVRDFVRGACNTADDFDPDNDASFIVAMRGAGREPKSVREIVEDADNIKESMIVLANAIKQWADDRNL